MSCSRALAPLRKRTLAATGSRIPWISFQSLYKYISTGAKNGRMGYGQTGEDPGCIVEISAPSDSG